jgi:beta-glucosidase-like glycosyl hydrolase
MLWWWLSCRRRATTSWWLLACIFLTVLLEQHSGLASPLWKDVCTQPESQPLPFCDTTLNLTMRVEDYQQRIPVEAQIQMMGNKAAGYDPLSIPPYQWWSEGLHGSMEPCVSSNGTCACPTSFPCPSALGTALNTTLYRLVGQAIGRQGRAVSNLRNHDMDIGDGLTYWSPNINMQRDPRWGRNQEGKIQVEEVAGL